MRPDLQYQNPPNHQDESFGEAGEDVLDEASDAEHSDKDQPRRHASIAKRDSGAPTDANGPCKEQK
jgi:hypothetical protein